MGVKFANDGLRSLAVVGRVTVWALEESRLPGDRGRASIRYDEFACWSASCPHVALAKAADGPGITKDDLERIRPDVVPGTSVLFIVIDEANVDRLGEPFHGRDAPLISTPTSPTPSGDPAGHVRWSLRSPAESGWQGGNLLGIMVSTLVLTSSSSCDHPPPVCFVRWRVTGQQAGFLRTSSRLSPGTTR